MNVLQHGCSVLEVQISSDACICSFYNPEDEEMLWATLRKGYWKKKPGTGYRKTSLNAALGSVKSSTTVELSMSKDETPEGRRRDTDGN